MKVIILKVSFLFRVCDSVSIFLQCFGTCGVSFLVFNESVEFFGDRKFLFRGMLIVRCDQVFHIVPVGLFT